MSPLANKTNQDMLGSNNATTTTANEHTSFTGTGNHTVTTKTGPVHNSETLNKLDPRVHQHKTTTT